MPSRNFIGQTFEFTGINDVKYTLTALTLEDWGTFVLWVQYKPYIDAKKVNLPKDVLDDILKECQRGKTTEEVSEGEFEEFNLNFSSTITREYLAKQEGVLWIIKTSLNKKHNINSVSEVFSMDDKLNELSIVQTYNKILTLSGINEEGEKTEIDDEEDENPTNPNTTNT